MQVDAVLPMTRLGTEVLLLNRNKRLVFGATLSLARLGSRH